MCVDRAHRHSCQPSVPWGIIKCLLIPEMSLYSLIEHNLHDYFCLLTIP